MSVPAGHELVRPALDATLAELLAVTRAQAVRLVDGRTGEIVGARVAFSRHGVRDDVGALVRLADAALPAAEADGGLADLVVGTPHATHLLRPGPFGTVLALRLDPGCDLAAARRALASPRLTAALHACRPGWGGAGPAQHDRSDAPSIAETGPMRVLRAVPAPRGSRPVRDSQPALATLSVVPFAARTGELAALALGGIDPVGPAPLVPAQRGRHEDVAIPLPRRGSPEVRPPDGPAAPAWSRDADTLRRLLDGLRRLA